MRRAHDKGALLAGNGKHRCANKQSSPLSAKPSAMRSTGGPDRAMTKIRDRFPDRPALVKAPGMFGGS